mgnify:CR=1 FL=1
MDNREQKKYYEFLCAYRNSKELDKLTIRLYRQKKKGYLKKNSKNPFL